MTEDESRLKATIKGVSTYFVGNIYEKADDGAVTKYYYGEGRGSR